MEHEAAEGLEGGKSPRIDLPGRREHRHLAAFDLQTVAPLPRQQSLRGAQGHLGRPHTLEDRPQGFQLLSRNRHLAVEDVLQRRPAAAAGNQQGHQGQNRSLASHHQLPHGLILP